MLVELRSITTAHSPIAYPSLRNEDSSDKIHFIFKRISSLSRKPSALTTTATHGRKILSASAIEAFVTKGSSFSFSASHPGNTNNAHIIVIKKEKYLILQ